jgi:hypothetical protein
MNEHLFHLNNDARFYMLNLFNKKTWQFLIINFMNFNGLLCSLMFTIYVIIKLQNLLCMYAKKIDKICCSNIK